MRKAQFTKSLTFVLNPEVFDKIKIITDESGESLGEWIRETIDIALSVLEGELNGKHDKMSHEL